MPDGHASAGDSPVRAILVSATRKSSGKTTVSIGLARAFRHRGLTVAPFKKGPDYIDPLWLASAAGAPCYNLDPNTQDDDEMVETFARATANVRLVEGSKGLFDSVDVEGLHSSAALSRLIRVPVVLVVDVAGITRGVAPLLAGYRDFERVDMAGVILNRVGGSRHESKLRASVERYTDLVVFGAIGRESALEIPERHLGLVPSNEHRDRDATISAIAGAIEKDVDVDRLHEAMNVAPSRPPAVEARPSPGTGLRLGVARDAAFGFYYADDLDYLERRGVTLSFFSPLGDGRLPECDALFIGGGFPESFAARLAANGAMRGSVRDFARSGGLIHAECGGTMYLGESLHADGGAHEMAGVLPIRTRMQARPVGRGLVRVSPTPAHPWPPGPTTIKAHEFHYARQVESTVPLTYAFDVLRGFGADGRHDGVVIGNVLATWTHQRHTRANPWLDAFVSAIERQRREKHHVDQTDRTGG